MKVGTLQNSHKTSLQIHKLEFVRCSKIHTFRYMHANDFCMHTKGYIQLEAVKLFVNILSQAQNVNDPYFLFILKHRGQLHTRTSLYIQQ